MAEWSDWYAKEDPTKWVLAEVLKRRATETPDREYLKFADNPWVSYGEVNARSNRVANALIARGVQPGESVSVMLPNCEEFLPVWFGILKAGAVMSSINTAYKGDFLSWTINLVESKKLFISDVFLDRLDLVKGELPLLEHVIVMKTGAQEGPDPSLEWEPLEALLEEGSDGEPDGVEYKWTDDARIMFTSGTTGRSKGVIKQNAADYFSARGLLEVVSATAGKSVESLAEDTFFSCLPLFHSNAQVLSGYPALVAGGRVAYVERFSSSRFWQQIKDAEATVFNSIGAVSYFIWNIPPSELDRAHKVHTCFAAPAPKDIYNEFQERFGVKFIEGYGLTETGMATYMDPTKPGVPGSMGKANPGYEVTIVEPGTDRPLPPDTPGEIVVDMKIPNIVMRAYYGMPEKTAEDFRNLKLHTGDLGRMDADGYFYFMDRREGLHPPPRRERLLDGGRAPGVRPPERQGGRGDRGEGRRGCLLGGRDHDRLHRRGRGAGPGRVHPLAGRADAVLHGPALHPLRRDAAQDADRARPEGEAARRGHHRRHVRS